MRIKKLAVAIAFFYKEDRLQYLRQISAAHQGLADEVKTFVVTNVHSPHQLQIIRDHLACDDPTIVTPSYLGHPYLLPWAHRAIFRDLIEEDTGFTHYLYTEDDMLITKNNVDYWLESMEVLRPTGFLPGFVRYEVNKHHVEINVDHAWSSNFYELFKLEIDDYYMIGLANPYHACYLLERDHLVELLTTDANCPDTGCWFIRAKAAQGLVFWNIPAGSKSRYLVKYSRDLILDPGAKIHHLAENYSRDPAFFGNLPVAKIVIKPSRGQILRGKIKTAVAAVLPGILK